MSTAQELARELSVSDRTVRRAVDRELIRGRRSSPNRLEIRQEERRYVAEHWPLLQKLVMALRTEPSVETAILYGSTARGTDSRSSDVDLVVQLRPGASTGPQDLGMRLAKSLNRDIEIVLLDEAASEPRLVLDIIEDGRPLVDRGERWRKLRRRRAALLREARERSDERNRAAHSVWAELDG